MVDGLGDQYSVSMWFYNGMPTEVRPITGYMFSRGPDGDDNASGDRLGSSGAYTSSSAGTLIFFNGNLGHHSGFHR